MRCITRRTFTTISLAASAAVASPAIIQAAEKPLRIGFSIAQTGNIAAGGRAGLAALEMWRDDVNGAGGLNGRNVEFVVYDDQSNPGLVPGIYAKLINLDRVDLLLLPYGPVAQPPGEIEIAAAPVVCPQGAISKNLSCISLSFCPISNWPMTKRFRCLIIGMMTAVSPPTRRHQTA